MSNTEAPPEAHTVPSYVAAIRDARAQIAPIDASITSKVIDEYNDYLAAGQEQWVRNCLEYREVFSEVERYTLYDASLLAGKAAQESGGCNMRASDWAGGRGLVQITSRPERRWIRGVATILSIDSSAVDYKHDPLHNVLMGTMFLDDYERQLGSRPHGLLAYNMGPGGVRKTVRRMGYNPSRSLPTIVQMYPHLTYNSRMKPRVYVARVLALAVMYDRVERGEVITPLDSLEVEDIPGWNPELDGSDWLDQFGS